MLENKDFLDFSITSWYEKFKRIALESVIIELPNEVLHVIQAEDVSEDDDKNIREVCPPVYLTQVQNALNTFNRNAFVKNNWHAPVDAKMFSVGNLLNVNNIDDIILYLSMSSTIQQDFDIVKGIPFCIVLRKWINIHPATEFRCIVINEVLRGITSRDWPTYYGHFKEEGPVIIEVLTDFYEENIKGRFPRKNYTFDVIFSPPDKPVLVDFSPLNSKTNLYAFSWKEIHPLLQKESAEGVAPVFRYLETDVGIMTKADVLSRIAQSY